GYHIGETTPLRLHNGRAVMLSNLSILSCHAETVCSLRSGSQYPQSSNLGKQGGSFQSEFRRCAAWSTDDPRGLLQRFHNQSAIGFFQGKFGYDADSGS